MKLTQTEAPVWVEAEPIVKREQYSAEAVIPDSREDAKCLVWAQGGVLLKGKEPMEHSCSFAGELWASVLYLTESGKTETLRIGRAFEMRLELENVETEALPQISWQLSALEGRLLNPRKIGVSFEVQAVIESFCKGKALLDSALAADAPAQIHLRRESREVLFLRQIREKTFTARERLSMGEEDQAPRSIAGERLRFVELSGERLGPRCIVKGELELQIWGLNETELPVTCSFRIPFSQLLDLNDEGEGDILVSAEPSSVYLEWMEGMAGERSLDAEIHGVLQLRIYQKQNMCYASDGYCSRMHSEPLMEDRTILRSLKRESLLLRGEESLSMPEDLQMLLAAEPFLGPMTWDREKTELTLSLDLLVRRVDGSLDTLHRSLRLEGDALPAAARPIRQEIVSYDFRTENGKLNLNCRAELLWELEETEKLETLSALELDEEGAWDPSAMPALSLVINRGETLWDLAKAYHSSLELIEACNPEPGEILLIPAE